MLNFRTPSADFLLARPVLDTYVHLYILLLFSFRYQHERAIAQGGYGLLLTRWDKRASAGQDLLLQSEELLKKVPVVRLPRDGSDDRDSSNSEGDIVIPLTGMLQLSL